MKYLPPQVAIREMAEMARARRRQAIAPTNSAGDVKETVALCRLGGAAHLAHDFISRKTPLAAVRAALARRGLELATAKEAAARRNAAERRRVAEDWDEVIGKLNSSA